jgi:addiction module HigA family antidote
MTQMFLFDNVAPPPSPGDVLRQKLLDEARLSQAELAQSIGISRPRLNMILKGRCQLSAEIALRIERVFGISPYMWLRVRNEYELYEERKQMSAELASLPQLNVRQEQQPSAWHVSDLQVAA